MAWSAHSICPHPFPDIVACVDSAALSLTKRAVSVTGRRRGKLGPTPPAGQQVSIKQLLADSSLLLWSVHTGALSGPPPTDPLPLLP